MHSNKPLFNVFFCFLIKISWRQGVFSFPPLATSVNRLWKVECFSAFLPCCSIYLSHPKVFQTSHCTGRAGAQRSVAPILSCILFNSDWFLHCPLDHKISFYLCTVVQVLCAAFNKLFPSHFVGAVFWVGGGECGQGVGSARRRRQEGPELGRSGWTWTRCWTQPWKYGRPSLSVCAHNYWRTSNFLSSGSSYTSRPLDWKRMAMIILASLSGAMNTNLIPCSL